MEKTTFRIEKMDCSAEEQLIRLKLQPLEEVKALRFDLSKRTLVVIHQGGLSGIRTGLEKLGLGAAQVSHEDAQTESGEEPEPMEKGPLQAAFLINAILFLAELSVGIWAYSMGLIADSLDMLADAIVYAMALTAVGGPAWKKQNIARLTGYFQVFLAGAGLLEVLRRAVSSEGMPDFKAMILLSIIALAGNSATLLILNKARNAGVHMKASWICTSVDVQVNLLVIASGVLVFFTHSRYPDLLAGTVIFLLVANGARKILALAKG